MIKNHAPDFLGLEGRVCVVTGGGSGIGRAIALGFATYGAKVAVLDRNLETAKFTLAEIDKLGGTGVAVACDVSDQASVKAAAANSAHALGS